MMELHVGFKLSPSINKFDDELIQTSAERIEALSVILENSEPRTKPIPEKVRERFNFIFPLTISS